MKLEIIIANTEKTVGLIKATNTDTLTKIPGKFSLLLLKKFIKATDMFCEEDNVPIFIKHNENGSAMLMIPTSCDGDKYIGVAGKTE